MKKLIKFTILLFTIFGTILLQNSLTATIANANTSDNGNEIITYSDEIEWRYKIINGKLYKRQYNASTKKWIGNWVPA